MAESKVVFTLIKLEVHSVGFHVSDFMCRMLEIHSVGFHVSDGKYLLMSAVAIMRKLIKISLGGSL